MKKKDYLTGVNFDIFIVKLNEILNIGFIITYPNGIPSIYYNTSPKEYKNILSQLNEIKLNKDVITTNIPDFVSNWAKTIHLIRSGKDQDTSKIPLDLNNYTEKQSIVIHTAHTKSKVNELISYGDVAELAGLPKAQRFVGSTMKKLRQPYIVPVHRVKSAQVIKKLNRENEIFKKMPI